MDFKKELEPYMQGVYKEFGFKYTKSRREAILKKGCLVLDVSVSYVGYFRSLYFVCYVRSPLFTDIMHEILKSKIDEDAGTLIKLFTNHALSDEGGKIAGFTREVVFSDGYPVEDRLIDEDVLMEFERLFTTFMLPWFERDSTLAGIRSSFRSAPVKTQTWNNLLYTHYSSMAPGGEFMMFYIDYMIGRLLNDEPRSAEELYRDEYEKAYLAKYEGRVEEKTGIPFLELEDIKEQFDLLPAMLLRLDAVTDDQWANYRRQLGVEI